jgi:hypothetical protein
MWQMSHSLWVADTGTAAHIFDKLQAHSCRLVLFPEDMGF